MRRRLLPILCLLAFAPPMLAPSGAFAADKKKGGGETYLQLPTLTAAIIRADGRRGVLTVEAGLDARDPGLREQVELLEPRLRDAYASSMMIVGSHLRPGEPVDLEQLETRLQADTDRVVGRRGVRLLLGSTLVN
jgi:hypothetical protein